MPNQAQVSTSLPLARTRGSIITPTGPAGMEGQPAKVDLQPVLNCDAAIKYASKYASPKPFLMDITTPWTTLVPACLKTSPPKTRSGASSLGWPQTGTQEAFHRLLSDLIDA